MRVFAHAIVSAKDVCGCALFLGRVWPVALFCASHALAAAARPRLDGLLINRWRSLAWPSSRRVPPRECAPFLRGQIRPPELKVTFLVARLRELVRVFPLLA